ncbi:response regulator [Algoriphagus oliviformis]|nr:response regulator [Algoriphagus oliviformis]
MCRRKLKVLLVDDDQVMNFVNKRMLEKSGHADTIEVGLGGRMGLELLANKQQKGERFPDLIMLDLNMPEINGWEFLDEYRKFSPQVKSKTLLVMLTSSLDPDDFSSAMNRSEVDEYYVKPLEMSVIEDLVAKCQAKSDQ